MKVPDPYWRNPTHQQYCREILAALVEARRPMKRWEVIRLFDLETDVTIHRLIDALIGMGAIIQKGYVGRVADEARTVELSLLAEAWIARRLLPAPGRVPDDYDWGQILNPPPIMTFTFDDIQGTE